MALLVGGVAAVAACNLPKPKSNKAFEDAAQRWKASQAVGEGIQKEVEPAEGTRKPGASSALHAGEPIWIQSGKSRVYSLPYSVTRVSIGNPDLAGVVVLNSRSILVNAKDVPRVDEAAGNQGTSTRVGVLSSRTLTPPPHMAETSIILWDSANHTDSHTVTVADFEGEQVLIEVTIAELNRTAMEERGIDFTSIGPKFRNGLWLGGGGPASPSTTTFTPNLPAGAQMPGLTGALPFPLTITPDRPTYAFQLPNQEITAFITMLQTDGLATVLAQPKIMALSGQNAVFQVGGEIPIRIISGFTADVEFKPFGTLVNFRPHVSEEGDIVLTVTPEVSQPDFNSPVEGIPTFVTRRASTSARLRGGETLVLGGLLQRLRIESERGVPYLKDIPGLGYIFRQTSYTDTVTELMVVATPHIVQPLAPGSDVGLPTDRGPMVHEETKTKPEANDRTRPRIPTPGVDRPNSRTKQ
jgi:pilus assembly protein CpaC